MPSIVEEYLSEQKAEQWLVLFRQPPNCRKLFRTWKPILEALDRLHNTNVRQFGCFMQAMTELAATSMPTFAGERQFSPEPIAYCMFPTVEQIITLFCVPNAIFVPVVDPVHGSVLQVKAVKPLKAGQQVILTK